jgi:hypothetical protein
MPSEDDTDAIVQILKEVEPDADFLGDGTLAAIARGEPIDYQTPDGSAQLDLATLVSTLQTYVPIASGIFGIGKIMYDVARDQGKRAPTAKEIAAAFLAQQQVAHDTQEVSRIAEAVEKNLK